ncbi:MAG TPA: DUF222 domain-containing protein [Streptosporangiaceae bacterium]
MASDADNPGPSFSSTGEALQVLGSAMGYLADADYRELPAQVLADVLAGMERIDAGQAAVRGKAGRAFVFSQAHIEFAQKSLGPWYKNYTRVDRATANAHKAWVRRYEEHPVVMAAVGEMGGLSESWARRIMGWTGKLPDEFVQKADAIMVEAVRNGVDLAGLARIAAELGALLADPDKDDGREPGPNLKLDLTFDGAGVLNADLSPAAAAKVKAVLEPLAAPAGPDDTRTHGQRMHDALEEAMTRLLAARLVPQSQGAPTTAIAHIHFGDLVAMDKDSVLLDRWKETIAAQWKAEQAGASTQPGDGGCWLTGDEARRIACDAMIVPIVTANLDPSKLGDLVAACLAYQQAATEAAAQAGQDARPIRDLEVELDDRLRQILGIVVAIASGAASFLRRNQLGRIGLGGPSLPLDVGKTDRIPAHIRRAVTLRDRGTCQFPGGCGTPAIWCEHHHTEHRAHGGPTSVAKIGLFCFHHHNVVIHKWGWSVVIEPDGTMTARRPDGSVYKRSHPPPPRPG